MFGRPNTDGLLASFDDHAAHRETQGRRWWWRNAEATFDPGVVESVHLRG
jgi:hypothetical protein